MEGWLLMELWTFNPSEHKKIMRIFMKWSRCLLTYTKNGTHIEKQQWNWWDKPEVYVHVFVTFIFILVEMCFLYNTIPYIVGLPSLLYSAVHTYIVMSKKHIHIWNNRMEQKIKGLQNKFLDYNFYVNPQRIFLCSSSMSDIPT